MNSWIQDIEIVDTHAELHGSRVHIFVKDGLIDRIVPLDTPLPEEYTKGFTLIIPPNSLKVSPGWFDMRTTIPDPGGEHMETLQSGAAAAARGGFTEVALLPDTQPPLQSKNDIRYLLEGNPKHPVQLHPIACITKNRAGVDLTEMMDLAQAGAVAFSDGQNSLANTHLFSTALQYLEPLKKPLIHRALELELCRFGQMNEGYTSTILGLRGIPHIAEEIMIQRDLSLLEYAGGRLHFALISSARSVELIRDAKKRGLAVSCDIAAHQLAFVDADLNSLDTNLKVMPPFRTEADREALWMGLKDGTIDVVVSDHLPQDTESKNIEFDRAEFGIIGLETTFALLNTLSHAKNRLSLGEMILKVSHNPRAILGLPPVRIQENTPANLTLFDTESNWTLEPGSMLSRSRNTPFLGKTFRGKARGIINRNEIVYEG